MCQLHTHLWSVWSGSKGKCIIIIIIIHNYYLCMHFIGCPSQRNEAGHFKQEELASLEELKHLVKKSLEHFSRDEICRVCGHLCASYSSRLQQLEDKLTAIQDKNLLIDALCDEVGLQDVDPLVSLMELLTVEDRNKQVLKCREVLLRHQEKTEELSKTEQLSKCTECTSPPGSPVYPYLCSRPTSFLIGNLMLDLKVASTKSSPVSPVQHPLWSPGNIAVLPSEIFFFQ